jgi:hypothetical protein
MYIKYPSLLRSSLKMFKILPETDVTVALEPHEGYIDSDGIPSIRANRHIILISRPTFVLTFRRPDVPCIEIVPPRPPRGWALSLTTRSSGQHLIFHPETGWKPSPFNSINAPDRYVAIKNYP